MAGHAEKSLLARVLAQQDRYMRARSKRNVDPKRHCDEPAVPCEDKGPRA
jgi:hypothetical protein